MEGASGAGAARCVVERASKQGITRVCWLSLVVTVMLGGCATPEAVAPNGKWRPLNHYTSVPQAIPLQQAYVFQAVPLDGTLKGMLTRWTKDAGVSLVYQHSNDYTLHTQAARIRASSLTEGADALSAAYAAEGVRVAVEGSRLVVSSIAPDASELPSNSGKQN